MQLPAGGVRAACGRRHCSWVSRAAPATLSPARIWGPTRQRGRSPWGSEHRSRGRPPAPRPHASPQTPKHPSHNSKPRLRPRSGKGHLSEPVLSGPGPARGSGGQRGAPRARGQHLPRRGGVGPDSPRGQRHHAQVWTAAVDRAGGRSESRGVGLGRTEQTGPPPARLRPYSPEVLVWWPCLERTETPLATGPGRVAGSCVSFPVATRGRLSRLPALPASRAAHATRPFAAGPLSVAAPGAVGGRDGAGGAPRSLPSRVLPGAGDYREASG